MTLGQLHSLPPRRAAPHAMAPDGPGRNVSRSMRYPARQLIYGAQDEAGRLYEVVQGAVFLSRYLRDGRRQIVDILRPGALFGFAGATHDCVAETGVASLVRSFDRDWAFSTASMARRAQAAMIEEVARLRDRMTLLVGKEARARVAGFLCAMADEPLRDGATITLDLTRGEIADYLGLNAATVSRTFSGLRQSGVIATRAGGVRVLVAQELRRLAQA